MDFIHIGLDGALCPLIVGYQSRIHRTWPALDARHHLLGIPELWYRLGMHKGGHLNAGHSGRAQPIDDFYLRICRDELWLNLKAIARPNFTNSDRCSCWHQLSFSKLQYDRRMSSTCCPMYAIDLKKKIF